MWASTSPGIRCRPRPSTTSFAGGSSSGRSASPQILPSRIATPPVKVRSCVTTVTFWMTVSGCTVTSVEVRHHLLAPELDRVQHTLVREAGELHPHDHVGGAELTPVLLALPDAGLRATDDEALAQQPERPPVVRRHGVPALVEHVPPLEVLPIDVEHRFHRFGPRPLVGLGAVHLAHEREVESARR